MFLRHLVDVHMGQWTVVQTEQGWAASYTGATIQTTLIAFSEQDAIVCLAFHVYSHIQHCTECPSLMQLGGRQEWSIGTASVDGDQSSGL